MSSIDGKINKCVSMMATPVALAAPCEICVESGFTALTNPPAMHYTILSNSREVKNMTLKTRLNAVVFFACRRHGVYSA